MFKVRSLMANTTFSWGDLSGDECSRILKVYYDEAVRWGRNLFKIPYGKVGNLFVRELSRPFRSYAEASSLESVALTAAVLFPVLVLQKPHPKSKPRTLLNTFHVVFCYGLRALFHV